MVRRRVENKINAFSGIPGLLPGPSGMHNNGQDNNFGK